ncbi:MAG TPA: GNAT family N-acetyltransferase [Aliidongia sp.]|uniref:GNAT family N-acetyltransferase n=1 Tax=Aliidongia sp. TaxID=1914230 RepID=UPI002DDD6A16|nr:GNAT family N-acetyltransferase [Aliidongia sp.]HEV2673444.1 GNAT family N-acetyltransferase [Aliidongia sp.]
MTADLVLRPALASDIETIISIESRGSISQFIRPWRHERHAAALENRNYAYLVAEVGDETVGFAIFQEVLSTDRAINLMRIAVDEPGQGYGKTLMRLALRHAFIDLGAHRLWLDVFAENDRARNLYLGLGFVEEGRLRDAAQKPDGFHDLIVMAMLEDEYRALPDAS